MPPIRRRNADTPTNHKEENMNPERFHQILRGFWESAVLFAAVKLGIFDSLVEESATANVLAKRLSLDSRGLEILLNALCSMELLSLRGGKYSLTPFSRAHLTRNSKKPLFGFVLHNLDLWEAWGDLPFVVKKGTPRKGFATRGYKTGKDSLYNFALAMHHGGTSSAGEIAGAFDYGEVNSIIDVGGCTGRYALFLKRKLKAKKAAVLDLPEMIREAKKIIQKENQSELQEIEFIPGDFFEFEAKGEFDLAIISNIIHSLSHDEAIDLVRRVRGWLSPGGKLLIHDMTVSDSRTKPHRAALFAVNMLVNTRSGTVYTEKEMTSMAREGGFKKVRKNRTSTGNLLLLCS